VARLLPLPRRLAERGVRRFGFHGLSYQWLVGEIARQWGPAAAHQRLVLAHLGGGASLAAVHQGRSIDTTMGFSPSGGIPMGTRSGDIDPGVVAYLARSEGLSAEAFATLATEQSGLLGISGTTGDVRELLARSPSDPRAAEAVDLFCYEVKKRIGAFAAALGGIDRLVFTGGIGQHAAQVRARICEGLAFLGVKLDPVRNAAHAAVISAADGTVPVQVIATDEERMVLEGVRGVLEEERKR
jgi:acetate kinase